MIWFLNSFTQSDTDFGQRALSFCVEVPDRKVLSEFAKDSKEMNAVNKNFWKENIYMIICWMLGSKNKYKLAFILTLRAPVLIAYWVAPGSCVLFLGKVFKPAHSFCGLYK